MRVDLMRVNLVPANLVRIDLVIPIDLVRIDPVTPSQSKVVLGCMSKLLTVGVNRSSTLTPTVQSDAHFAF